MVTQVNDFIRLCFEGAEYKDLLIKNSGMTWPPPDLVSYCGMIFRKLRVSTMPDVLAADPYTARSAEYGIAPMHQQLLLSSERCLIPELVVLPHG